MVNEERSWDIAFTPDGQWLVQAMDESPHQLKVIGADGSVHALDDVHDGWVRVRMSDDSDVFATLSYGNDEPWGLWSAPEQRLLSLGRSGFSENTRWLYWDLGRRRVLFIVEEDEQFFVDAHGFDGTSKRLGELPFNFGSTPMCSAAPDGGWTAYVGGRGVQVIEFGEHGLFGPRPLHHIQGDFVDIECDPRGRIIVTQTADNHIQIWDSDGEVPSKELQGPAEISRLRLSDDASLLEIFRYLRETNEVEIWIWSLDADEPHLLRHIELGKGGASGGAEMNPVELQHISIMNPDPKIRMWPLRAPADSDPVIMQLRDVGDLRRLKVHPQGQWIAVSTSVGLSVWPVARPYPHVIKQYGERAGFLTFGPDGGWLATSTIEASGMVRLWRLDGDSIPPAQILHEARNHAYGVAASPEGDQILVGTHTTGAQLLSLDGRPPRRLTAPDDEIWAGSTAFSPDGRFAAAATVTGGASGIIRVWDLSSSDNSRVFEHGSVRSGAPFIRFTSDGDLLVASMNGLLRWEVETGDHETLFEGPTQRFAVTADDSKVLLSSARSVRGAIANLGEAMLLDLATGQTRSLSSHGDQITAVAMDAAGTLVATGDVDGVIRVGSLSGEEPHLLLGNPGEIFDIAVDPKGRWIAASSGTELRLWPIPDLSKPPLHTLPREELIAKLKTLTNLRVVRDAESATGWKLSHDPFPGWETVPTW